MPVFEYHCTLCDLDFEMLVMNAAASESISCPTCSADDVVKKFSTFATAVSAKDAEATPAPVPSAPCGPACGCHH
ncbi:MAG: zinc ribbon domain-containing protein [Gemmatimonadetes bacterium]|nr:zinc ribbon domain-containing protein [Gemmatimonadota bacterium]MYG86266.1 zinc ribbon domain-containing protein [Gemmatimonadota bacterium]MYJ90234.1 zinc ribbon domain-containing protein [Gemmatimonadota bacterium]